LVNQKLYRLCQANPNDLVVLSDSWAKHDPTTDVWEEVMPPITDDMSEEEVRQTTIDFEKQMNQSEASTYISYRGVGTTIYNKEWFDGYEEVLFGDFKVRVPRGWHEYLTYHYGNYMTPPQPIPFFTHSLYYVNLHERLDLKEVKRRMRFGEKQVL
jgi:hypothetical protein